MAKKKVEKTEKPERIFVNPFSEQFLPHWDLWKDYKREQWKFQYKSVISEQGTVNELVKLSEGNETIAIAIITQSIARGWKGFFKLKPENIQPNGQFTNHSQTTRESVNDAYSKRFAGGE